MLQKYLTGEAVGRLRADDIPGLQVSMIGRPHQRRAGDLLKTQFFGDLGVALELRRRDEFLHRQMILAWLQILAYRQHAAAMRQQILHHLDHLGFAFADACLLYTSDAADE